MCTSIVKYGRKVGGLDLYKNRLRTFSFQKNLKDFWWSRAYRYILYREKYIRG